jgi:FlaA1/EpsC-like NDP-sugar epimerase
VDYLLQQDVKKVVAVDNNESEIYMLGEEYAAEPRLEVALGDVRSPGSIASTFRGADMVFHGAALKHVKLGEHYPDEIIATNIAGVQNVVRAALEHRVERVVFMSSDKAVNPTNVMGTSKLMGERLISAANYIDQNRATVFASTRFGNVLGSRGSMLPTFLHQMRAGEPITLTSEEMSRFVMTKEEAVSLVTEAAQIAEGGEVFVTKMPVMRIVDVVTALQRMLAPEFGCAPEDFKVKVVGKRPGEKIYEELLSDEECSRSLEVRDFFVIHPAVMPNDGAPPSRHSGEAVSRVYRSDQETPMTVDEIIAYFKERRLLDAAVA